MIQAHPVLGRLAQDFAWIILAGYLLRCDAENLLKKKLELSLLTVPVKSFTLPLPCYTFIYIFKIMAKIVDS